MSPGERTPDVAGLRERRLAAVPLAGEFILLLTPTRYKGDMEQASLAGITLLDRLLTEAPDEPTLMLMEANLYANLAITRMAMQRWQEDEPGRAKMAQSPAAPAVRVARAVMLLAVADGSDYQQAARSAGRKSGDAVSHLVERRPLHSVEAKNGVGLQEAEGFVVFLAVGCLFGLRDWPTEHD